MALIPSSTVQYFTRPTVWIVVAVIVAAVDLLAPVHLDLCVAFPVLLPIMWLVVLRRYMPLLTVVFMIATLLPGIMDLAQWSFDNDPVDHSDPHAPFFSNLLVRVLTLGAIVSAWLFNVSLQRSRFRRLQLRAELQRKVRQRTEQLQNANLALRTEITQRRQTQHLLDRSEMNFNSVTTHMQLQVLRKDSAGVITYANDTFCKQLGRDQADVVGSTDEDLYPLALAQSYRADDESIMLTGETVEHIEQHPTSDGQRGYVQVFKAPEYDQHGNCTGVQVVFWDVTEKHRSEIALRNSQARKRALFELAGDAILLVDADYRVVEANPSATVLFHLSETQLVHRPLAEIASPRVTQLELAQSSQSLVGHQDPTRTNIGWETLPRFQRCELTIARSDNSTFESEVSLHPIPIGNAEGTAIFLRDVTLRRQAFDAMREAKSAAEAASRSKSEFLAGVSHELRTPLGGIIGLSDLLAETQLTARGGQYVAMIRRSASLLADIIEDLLDFAALEAGRVQINLAPMDPRRVIGDAFKTLAARAIGKPLHMIFSVDPATPHEVIGDAKRLRQVVINLASNAIKFTPTGEVHVRLSVQVDASGRDAASHENLDKRVILLDVIDTGVGIPADKHQRVFDAFERGDASTTRRFGGTGLGLSISNGLVQRFGGSIELKSQVDVGSTFRCRLPMKVTQDQPPGSDVRLPNSAVVSIKNASMQTAVTEMISGLGIQCLDPVPNRVLDAGRPLVWLIDETSPYAASVAAERHRDDRVIWITRLGHPSPPLAAEEDSILIEPVLPNELLEVLSGHQSKPPSTAVDAAITNPDELDYRTRLLVVDDSEVNRVLLKDQLTAAGYSVDLACDGLESLDRVRTRTYACILMDLQMPEMDGPEATRALRELYRTRQQEMPPVIALTAHVTEHHRQQCLDAGMSGFLTKPVNRKQLLQTIAESIGVAPTNDDNLGVNAHSSHTSTVSLGTEPWQNKLHAIAGDDLESVHSICEAFIEEVPALVQRLSTAVQTNDHVGAARAAHTLKSCLKHVAGDDDVMVLSELESRTQRGEPISASELERATTIAAHWIELVQAYASKLSDGT